MTPRNTVTCRTQYLKASGLNTAVGNHFVGGHWHWLAAWTGTYRPTLWKAKTADVSILEARYSTNSMDPNVLLDVAEPDETEAGA